MKSLKKVTDSGLYIGFSLSLPFKILLLYALVPNKKPNVFTHWVLNQAPPAGLEPATP